MVASTGAGDVKQVPFGVVDILKIGFVRDSLNSFLKRNHLVITGHYSDSPELQALCQS